MSSPAPLPTWPRYLMILTAGLCIGGPLGAWGLHKLQHSTLVSHTSEAYTLDRAIRLGIQAGRYPERPELSWSTPFKRDGSWLKPAGHPNGPTLPGTVLGQANPAAEYRTPANVYDLSPDRKTFVLYHLEASGGQVFVTYTGTPDGFMHAFKPGEALPLQKRLH